MLKKITQINEVFALSLTKTFGTMWVCYGFMVYGLLPLLPMMHAYQDTFLYWSNWVQLWSLPLLLVGTNILGRSAEQRAKYDHEKLGQSYDEQILIYQEILQMMKRQEQMIADLEGLSCHPKNPTPPTTVRKTHR